MSKTLLELEPELTSVLRPLSDQPLGDFVKELAILELYRRRVISSGKAAELLGRKRVEFVAYASRLGIPFLDMEPDELDVELAHLQSL